MAEDALHSIRFKRGDVEFAMTGTREDVARAWDLLSDRISASFAEQHPPPREKGRAGAEHGEGQRSKPKQRRRGRSRGQAATTGEGDRISALLGAQIDDFPDIGEEPTALYAGYATLSWARDKLQIDGLAASEIQEFLQKKLRIKNTSQAYRQAFSDQPRAVDKSNDRPALFKLMRPGERALEVYRAEVASGASPAEAQQAGDEAEQEAEEA